MVLAACLMESSLPKSSCIASTHSAATPNRDAVQLVILMIAIHDRLRGLYAGRKVVEDDNAIVHAEAPALECDAPSGSGSEG